MRWRNREATVGAPPRFLARLTIAWRAPSAATKSCAVWPMRRSGAERPSAARIGRLRKASVSRGRRPYRLVEPGEQRQIEGQQARLEQAENLQSRMRRCARRGARWPASDRVEQRGVVGKGAGETQLGALGPFVEEFAQRLAAVRLAPFLAGSILFAVRGEGVERGAMGGDEQAERRLGAERSQRRRGGVRVAQQRLGGAPVVLVEALARLMGVTIAGGETGVFHQARRCRRGQRAA